jgi:hypothetical protein
MAAGKSPTFADELLDALRPETPTVAELRLLLGEDAEAIMSGKRELTADEQIHFRALVASPAAGKAALDRIRTSWRANLATGDRHDGIQTDLYATADVNKLDGGAPR